jgi:peptidoglycan/LPS O-acetylase OafA/YrhL
VQFVLHGKNRAVDAYLFYYWGILTSLLIFAVVALENPLGHVLLPLEKPIRWCAAHTFSLYLFHFPLLVLINFVTHYNRGSVGSQALVFTTLIALCILLSTFTESKKLWWRKVVRRLVRYLSTLRPQSVWLRDYLAWQREL